MKHTHHLATVASPNDAFRAWLVYALQERGYEVSVTTSGEEALGWAQESPPRIMFVSAMLDDILGFEVIERTRLTQPDGSTRLVLIGAIFRAYRYHSTPKNLYGADAYIEEGIVEEELDKVLRELVGAPRPVSQEPAPTAAPAQTPASATARTPSPAPASKRHPAELIAQGGDVIEEAMTLARIIISDIYIYQPIKARRSILRSRFEEAFVDDLRIGRAYFEKRIPADVLRGRDVFRETLDEFLTVKKKEYESGAPS